MSKGFNDVLGNLSAIAEEANAAACHCSSMKEPKANPGQSIFWHFVCIFRASARSCREICPLWQGLCADPGHHFNFFSTTERLYGLQKQRVEQRCRAQFCCRTEHSKLAQCDEPTAETTPGGCDWWLQLMVNLASVSN